MQFGVAKKESHLSIKIFITFVCHCLPCYRLPLSAIVCHRLPSCSNNKPSGTFAIEDTNNALDGGNEHNIKAASFTT
jgi:hypothetical protein